MEPNRGPEPTGILPILEYQGPSSAPRRIGFLALAATVLLPGLGHCIAGFFRRGAIWLGIAVAVLILSLTAGGVPALVPALIVLIPVSVLVQLWMWIDAFRCGRRTDAPRLGRMWINFPGGVLLVVVALMANPALPVAMMFKQYVAEAFIIPSDGMNPAIASGDRVVVHKRTVPSRWSIIAFDSPNSPGSSYLQRVVGLPGETIEIIDGVVYVNGKVEPAPPGVGPYLPAPQMDQGIGGKGNPIRLGPDEYYVLGDNSTISLDSRYWNRAAPGHQLGALPRSSIIGVATWVYLPVGHWKRLY